MLRRKEGKGSERGSRKGSRHLHGRERANGAATPDETHRFTGQVFDQDTGLYFYGARYYDQDLARFVQPDTIIPDLWNPQNWNRYAYVLNNPLRYTDPTGHAGEDANAPKVSWYERAKLHLMLADPKNWGQPLMVGGPAADQVLRERKKASEAIANANQKVNEIQSLTPEGQLKKLVKQELAKQQNDNTVSVDPPSPANEAGQQLAEKAIDAAIDEAAKGNDPARPAEPYNREKHYGKTPTKGDRKAVGAGKGDVADHDPPLVKRYYEGDPARGEKPGYQMTDPERRGSAGDRSRMQPQPKSESNKQGADMSKYSREKKKEHGL